MSGGNEGKPRGRWEGGVMRGSCCASRGGMRKMWWVMYKYCSKYPSVGVMVLRKYTQYTQSHQQITVCSFISVVWTLGIVIRDLLFYWAVKHKSCWFKHNNQIEHIGAQWAELGAQWTEREYTENHILYSHFLSLTDKY